MFSSEKKHSGSSSNNSRRRLEIKNNNDIWSEKVLFGFFFLQMKEDSRILWDQM